MEKLQLVVQPSERETLPSFFSRMAAINGSDATGFALDIGVSLKRILSLEEFAVGTFADRSGLAPAQLATMLSWTGERVGDVRMKYRGEVFVSRAVRNPVVRGCPHCLRAVAGDQTSPLRHLAMAGDWLCRGVDVCLRHRHPLVPLWERPRPIDRDDVGARLTEILPALLAGRFDRDLIESSAYDRWLDRRLSQGEDDTWLGTQPLFVAMTFCALLGTELLRVQEREAEDRTAKALGFDVLSRGPEAIVGALDLLTLAGDGGHFVTKGALGTIFGALDHLYRNDDSFDGFRDIVRRHVLSIWPVAGGDEILGQVVSERRLHSLVSASTETGIGKTVLNDFLTEAGAFAPDDARADLRKTFDAKAYQFLLDEIPTLVGPIAMRKAIGATRAELMSLAADRILVPRTKVATIKSPWRVSDGVSLLKELEREAIALDADAPGWETIQHVHKRLGVSVGEVIAAIRDGGLSVGKRAEVFGYHAFVVQSAKVDQLTVSRSRKESMVAMEGELNAAAFARSVGIRKKGAFLALIEGGHTPATKVLHPVTKRPQWRMNDADIAAFHEKFTTPTVIGEETGHHRNTILAALSVGGIRPFRPNDVDAGPVYLRDEVAGILGALKS
ncbi:TniQ family protein [Roseicitreum antarcticum]|uniref:TniQ family protein n=1 Tax=Roseicitreum antarcticum TaxID=564137 RepID=UPI001CC1DA1B|nr:TniQ family protein [Roseicitreum antarcticum]